MSRELSPASRSVYALGDFTVNTALAALSLVYTTYFLTQVAGLRPALAGLVPLIGRFVDAISDPAMGRLSDRTTLQGGRRRPYFLLGSLPFGLAFALLWTDPGVESQGLRFAYFTGIYCLLTLAMTVLSVPYLALIPEMATDYDDRTSLNTYRNAGAVLGIFAAIATRPLAQAFGGGSTGFALTGVVFGVALGLPWLAVYRVSFERDEFRNRPVRGHLLSGLRSVLAHRTFSRLTALYLCGRIAMDLSGAMMILYFSYWIGRSEDFEPTMFLFLACVLLSLPIWLRVARHMEKATVFMVGAVWWTLAQTIFLIAMPDWPRWLLFAYAPVAALGYAVVDLMPWAMVGDVIDEDDVVSGERREGLYNGVFTFLRKLGGALGVFVALTMLDWAGLGRGDAQPESARQMIRWLAGLGPMALLALAALFARGYPLTRSAHAAILGQIRERETLARDPGPTS
ncbi:MAG: MFS transporter [Myxococcota bacterium]